MDQIISTLFNTNSADFIHENMNNGEIRCKLKINNKKIYSYTITRKSYGWQNAHYHTHACEKYFVKNGSIIIAIKDKYNNVSLKRLNAGDSFLVSPKVEHNVFVNNFTLFFVEKKSNTSLKNDWYYSSNFDNYTKCIFNN